MSNPTLELGWCQGYMALQYHMEEAYKECNIKNYKLNYCPPIAIFSKKYYNDINKINYLHKDNKKYDFCFIGSIKSSPDCRKWVIDFAKKYFTSNSIFVNTDTDPNWSPLGNFDISHLKLGFAPKEQQGNQSKKVQYRVVNENLFYFETMCQSKFVLCPAGDAPWSFRFYEVLMCKSIPIVETWHHTYRTKEESEIPYKYIIYNKNDDSKNDDSINNIDKDIPYDDYLNENTKIFEKYHMLN